MAKRTAGVLKACLVAIVVLVVLLAGLPVLGSSVPTSGSLEVTGYTLENTTAGGNTSAQIFINNSLTVVLNITDSRLGAWAGNTVKPIGRLNTNSFTIPDDRVYRVPSDDENGNSTIVVDANGTVSYQLRFQDMTYTGTGKTFRCDLFYQDTDIPLVSYEFDINQCVEYVAPPSSSSDTSSSSTSAVVKGTGFVLQEASYGQTTVYAGQSFNLTATLLATNGDHSVENVTVGITPPKELSLQDGSSLAYVGTVKPGQSIPAEFKLVPGANVEEGSYTAVIDIKGVDAKTGEAVSAQVSISVPVMQPERFEIFNTQLPSQMISGMDDGSGYGSITLVNQGKGTVSNVSVEIQGAGLSTEEGKQYIGHVAGGEQKTADFNIQASEPGQIAASAVVSYESTRGEKKELTYDFTISVEDGGMLDMGGMDMGDIGLPEPQPQGGIPVWGWLLIVLGVGGVVVAALLVVKRVKARKAAALEDDYDEDE